MTARKIGYYDLDPDVLNEIILKASTGSVAYNDTQIKEKIKALQTRLNSLDANGTSNSFNKYMDKVTVEMLDDNLKKLINNAAKLIGNSDSSQEVVNQELLDGIEKLVQICAKEATDRKTQGESNKKVLDDISATLTNLTGIVESMRNQVENMGPGSVMTGATSTSNGAPGMVPQPLKGQQSSFLTGDAQWTPIENIVADKAINDKNASPITDYITDAKFKPENKSLVFYRGDGTEIEITLGDQNGNA